MVSGVLVGAAVPKEAKVGDPASGDQLSSCSAHRLQRAGCALPISHPPGCVCARLLCHPLLRSLKQGLPERRLVGHLIELSMGAGAAR